MMDLYSHVDKLVAEFQITSGLRCPSGCGSCCQTSDVEATVPEMLPLAVEIFRDGQAEYWLERLKDPERSFRCALFSENRVGNGDGYCRYYAQRPVLCRLFGFSSVRNRNGKKILALCRQMKQFSPEIVGQALEISDQAPCFSEIYTWVYDLDPAQGARPLPINMALAAAIERVGLQMTLGHFQMLRDQPAA